VSPPLRHGFAARSSFPDLFFCSVTRRKLRSLFSYMVQCRCRNEAERGYNARFAMALSVAAESAESVNSTPVPINEAEREARPATPGSSTSQAPSGRASRFRLRVLPTAFISVLLHQTLSVSHRKLAARLRRGAGIGLRGNQICRGDLVTDAVPIARFIVEFGASRILHQN
jgi:hypothetical protein